MAAQPLTGKYFSATLTFLETQFFNTQVLDALLDEPGVECGFRPWWGVENLLRHDAFTQLLEEFPSMELFEKHKDIERRNQRPHDRYYLGYEASPYHDKNYRGPGIVDLSDLSSVWCEFLNVLQNSHEYHKLLRSKFKRDRLNLRFAWHLSHNKSEVSPHTDGHTRLGSQIFYFNTSEDWNREWGGEIILFDDKHPGIEYPGFDQFGTAKCYETIGNRSVLFCANQNTWHGVRELTCPDDHFRRSFNVIIEYPKLEHLLLRARRKVKNLAASKLSL